MEEDVIPAGLLLVEGTTDEAMTLLEAEITAPLLGLDKLGDWSALNDDGGPAELLLGDVTILLLVSEVTLVTNPEKP
jgi:hypothetical protein